MGATAWGDGGMQSRKLAELDGSWPFVSSIAHLAARHAGRALTGAKVLSFTYTLSWYPGLSHGIFRTQQVPAALRVRRDEAPKPKRPKTGRADAGSGFGLAPAKPGEEAAGGGAPAAAPISTDQKYLEFLATVADLGAFD